MLGNLQNKSTIMKYNSGPPLLSKQPYNAIPSWGPTQGIQAVARDQVGDHAQTQHFREQQHGSLPLETVLRGQVGMPGMSCVCVCGRFQSLRGRGHIEQLWTFIPAVSGPDWV